MLFVWIHVGGNSQITPTDLRLNLRLAGTTGGPLQFLCQVRDPTLDNPNLVRSRTTGRIQHVKVADSKVPMKVTRWQPFCQLSAWPCPEYDELKLRMCAVDAVGPSQTGAPGVVVSRSEGIP